MRKRKGVVQVLLGIILAAALVLIPMACKAPEEMPQITPTTPPEEVAPPEVAPPEEEVAPPEVAPPEEEVAPPEEEVGVFRGLADVPEIENKTPMHLALAAGGGGEDIRPFVERFSEHTGVPITLELLIMAVQYPKINLELISGTGAYDVFVVESAFTNEWAPYMWKLEDLAAQYDPGGVAALRRELATAFDPGNLRAASDRAGNLMELPYFTYQQCMFYREDLFNDPTEKANFEAKYGYELAPPTTYEQVYDMGEFFTRKKGELLKGEPLKENIYGEGLMAGRFEINDEISARIWSRGGHWATLVRDEAGNPVEFVITKKDKEILRWALESYKSELKFASPGCQTGFWDWVAAQMEAGLAVFTPHFYICLHPWANNVENKVPGASLALAAPPEGAQGYYGSFCNGIAKATKNPEAAYWLVRYLSSYEAQKELAERDWANVLHLEVLEDTKYRTGEWPGVQERADILLEMWREHQTVDEVNDYIHFNSEAMGKIYEVQIILCHEGVVGMRTIDETVAEITRQTIDLQQRFGSLPIREEL